MVTDIRKTVPQGAILACYAADLSTRAGAEDLFNAVTNAGHKPDILINNAGIAMFGRFDELPTERWEQLMQINLLAPMRLTGLFLPQMIERQQGHIVNISSLAGWVGTVGLTPYNAAKFGLRGFSEGLMEDLQDHNINVTTVYPFFSKTNILDAPHYGSFERRTLPDSIVTHPADVMAQVLKGVENNIAHVFPDPTAYNAHLLKRYFPRAVKWVNDWLERRTTR